MGVRSPWPDLLMILARGPDSALQTSPGIDVTAPLPRVVRRTLPETAPACRPLRADAGIRAVGPASQSNPFFPRGLAPLPA